jgi:hypothetical protein
MDYERREVMSDLTCTNCGEYVGSPIADRIAELEAKLAKAVELANLVEEFSDRTLWKVVKELVLELKGEK